MNLYQRLAAAYLEILASGRRPFADEIIRRWHQWSDRQTAAILSQEPGR